MQVHQKETLVYEEELREAQDKKEKPQVIKVLNMKVILVQYKELQDRINKLNLDADNKFGDQRKVEFYK